MTTDHTDDLIEALVTARERGLSRVTCLQLVHDVFAAPWSFPYGTPEKPLRNGHKSRDATVDFGAAASLCRCAGRAM